MTQDGRSNKRRSERASLLQGTFASFLATLIGILANIAFSKVLPLLLRVHWTIWVSLALGSYLIVCYIFERKRPITPIIGKIFRIPLWTELRSFGEQPAARISYWILIAVPVMVYAIKSRLITLVAPDLELPLNLKLTYFASWFIALPLIVFKAVCPKEIRRTSPLDKVRPVNIVLNNVGQPNISIEAEEKEIESDIDGSLLEMRTLCFSFYTFGTMSFLRLEGT